jgi:hypothetical protein
VEAWTRGGKQLTNLWIEIACLCAAKKWIDLIGTRNISNWPDV